jgi:hypothetical protein
LSIRKIADLQLFFRKKSNGPLLSRGAIGIFDPIAVSPEGLGPLELERGSEVQQWY